MKSDFMVALKQLAAERNLPQESVLSAIEAALASAYKRDNESEGQNIAVRLDPGSGGIRAFVLLDVVEEVEDSRVQMTVAQARKIKKDAAIGDVVEIESETQLSGRIAAQTAKQVVMQRLREAEREIVFEEYSGRAEDVVTGTIQRMEPRQITLDLGRTEAILPEVEQVPTERYRHNQKLKVFIVEVARTVRGPEIIVSRSHKNLLKRLFELEVPEIFNGIVEIKAIAREPGSRSKVAVWATQQGVDAVGSCVGLRGIRIQNIVNELQGEKIDVVQWHRDPSIFISNSLNPSQVLRVELNEDELEATVVVQEKQISLAIGREGQNARLAAKLTGWKIDILSSTEAEMERMGRTPVPAAAEAEAVSAEVDVEPVEAVPVAEVEVSTDEPAAEPVAEPAAEPVAAEQPDTQAVAEAETADAAEVVEVAETEEEEVTVEAPVLSAEEELAALSIPPQDDTEDDEEEDESIPLTDDVWKVPQLASVGGSQIRFAEDIMVSRAPEGRRRGRGRGGGMEDSRKARKAAAKRSSKQAGGGTPAP